MESYCNQNASGGRNYCNLPNRGNGSSVNCACNNTARIHDNQNGSCSRNVQGRARMAQQCRREERTTQCERENQMTRECLKKCLCEEINHKHGECEECTCQTNVITDCHRHDEMEQLGCEFPVVMAYVPWQQWGEMYEAECGLMQGTIFKDLNYVFCGERC